ncbi:Transmembrane protein 154, partial [Pristimantis euphronides]
DDLIPTTQTYAVPIAPEDETLSPSPIDSITEIPSDVTEVTRNITELSDAPGLDVITILIYAAPAIILVLLIPIIIIIVRRKRRKKKQEDVPINEDVKSPIFEEDTPSVMEIEMDDLDKWMSNMKNSKYFIPVSLSLCYEIARIISAAQA